MSSRRATHAGTWYVGKGAELDNKLSNWISSAKTSSHRPARAIISPHAGYTYCGSCAAHAYSQIDPTNVEKVFILGPSHHFYLRECALSSTSTYVTPLYNLKIDQKVYQELYGTGNFSTMSINVDEDEHSIEMQLPYIAKVMESKKDNFTIVPILVGSLDQESERKYGELLAKYIANPANVFVISSDFCHWGSRFRYTHYEEQCGEIYKSIEELDRKGMNLIEKLDPEGFHAYLAKYKNTICGRHPIGIMLNAVQCAQNGNGLRLEFKFLDYQQSSKCTMRTDSSVSYASGSLVAIS